MTAKKPSAKQRRRFQHALLAAVSMGEWSDSDLPIVIALRRKYFFGQRWRGAKRDWGREATDSWTIEISAPDNADFLDGYRTVMIELDRKNGDIQSPLHGKSLFVARIAAIGTTAWNAGIRTIEATLKERPSGHERLELVEEAERWLSNSTLK